MKKRFAFLLILFCFIHASSQTRQSDALLNQVLKQLNLNQKDIHEKLYREKVMPNKTSKSILVIPKYRINETDGQGHDFFQLDAYIVVADHATGKILSKYVEPNAWTSDAMVLSDITIDTGIYQLNPQNRAFGIRLSYEGSSRPNPFNRTDLSLFIIQNNAVKRVLNNYPISDFHGEWDTNCAGEFEDINTVLDIDKNQTNGFNNLILKNKIEHTKNIPTKDDCVEKKTSKTVIKSLKYNGKEYK